MWGIRKLLALLGLLLATAERARPQPLVVVNPYLGTSGTGIFYTHGSRHGRLTISLGSYSPGGYYYGYGSPFFAGPYGYNSISSVTVVYGPPPLLAPPLPFLVPQPLGAGQPFGGGGGGTLRLDDLGQLDPTLRADHRMPATATGSRAIALCPAAATPGVHPLAPDNRDRAARPVPAEPPRKPDPPPEAPRRPAPMPVPFDPAAELPRPARPDADQKAEGERQLKLARDAFAAQEYGRAAQLISAKRLQACPRRCAATAVPPRPGAVRRRPLPRSRRDDPHGRRSSP